jgi:hypothetical protein
LASPTLTIFDLEYTAWECSMARHWLAPGEFREVVQIGAVRLDADSFAVLDEFDALVRPRVNPDLSPYFEKLTGITSGKIARSGQGFAAAYGGFLAFAGDGPIAAFGRDDRVLQDNLRLYGLSAPIPCRCSTTCAAGSRFWAWIRAACIPVNSRPRSAWRFGDGPTMRWTMPGAWPP